MPFLSCERHGWPAFVSSIIYFIPYPPYAAAAAVVHALASGSVQSGSGEVLVANTHLVY